MDRPFQAYEGDEPYVFVCYSHDDKALVYPELTRLRGSGVHIWYDEGIGPGSEWSDSIATHIEGCAVFLYFVTPQSVVREYCRRELNFAVDQSRRVLAVHLVPTELPSGLKLTLSNRQAILKYDEPRSAYEAKLARALGDTRSHDDSGPSTTDRRGTITPRRWHAKWVAGAALALAIAAGLSVWFANRPTQVRPLPDRSLAVMPFSVVGSDAGTGTYADALTQELRTDVADYWEIRSVAVAEATNIHDVSDASYVASGNVQLRGADVRVRASLTRTDDRQTIWAESFEPPASDRKADPAQVAATIARFIRRQVVQDQECESVRRTSRSAEAATAYCAGFAEGGRFQQVGGGDAQLVLRDSQHAIALDPGMAAAYGAVAGVYSRALGGNGAMDWREAARRANDALAKGFAIAPNDPRLLAERGYLQYRLELNYPAAETSLRASLEADPLWPGAQWNYVGLGDIALAQGNLQGALEHFRRALRMDDYSAEIYARYVNSLWSAGEDRESIKIADAGLDLVQSGGTRLLLLVIKARAHFALGETAAANAALDDALASVGPALKPMLAGSLAKFGRTEEARQLLARLEAMAQPPIANMVFAYTVLDHDRAFEWIHTAIDDHVWIIVGTLRVNPLFSELRTDPRWAEVMAHLESEEAKGRTQQD